MMLRTFPAVALSVLIFTGCSDTSEQTEQSDLRPVRTIEISDVTTERSRTFSGLIRSSRESRLSFKVTGTIVSIPVQAGAAVKKGDTIARLDSSSYELELEQSRAKRVQAQASQRNAASTYGRVKGLYENSNASKNELDTARANSETATAEVRAANKAVEIANLNRSYTNLRASADCTIASVAVEQNENITAGSEVATVNCGAGLEVQLGIPESLIGGLRQGMAAEIRPNTGTGTSYPGSVSEIGVGASSSAATYPVVVTIENSDAQIRPNMAAQVSFRFDASNTSAFRVPAASVANDPDGTFVYLAVPGEAGQATVKKQIVEVGELTGEGLEILSGIAVGDHVITAGLSFVHEGQIVLLLKDS